MASVTEQAVRRLNAALQSLEQAVEQRLSSAVGAEGLAEEVHMLTADRAQLAEALDQAKARAARLETINRDVSRRLDDAMDKVRTVLESGEGGA
jgi:L-lactate utilization protein LutB